MEKEILKIKIDKGKNIDILFKSELENQKTIKMIKKGVLNSFNYFNNVKTIKFTIELIYSRKEFDKMIGSKTESWVTAHSFGNRFIIFSPSEIEKCTSHRRNEFMPIISHETSHVLLKKLNTNFCTWMNEGIAQYTADQERKEKIKLKNISCFFNDSLFKNSNYDRFISRQGYEISYKLVNYLMANYSKKIIIKLLQVKYDFVKSSEKDVCKILNTNKDKLIAQFEEVLENSQ